MSEIVPTITTNDKNIYHRQYQVYTQFAKRVHVDICDGIFAPSQTIDVSYAWRDQSWAPMDLHMMVMNPSQHLQYILKVRPALCIFHAEASENLLPLFATLKQANIRSGVAILKQTYPGKIAAYLKAADQCLIFAGKLGYQGGEADMLQIEKIPIVRSISPQIEIAWDGGANLKNIRELSHAGADIINVGSAIASAPDPAKMYAEMMADLDKPGVVV